jgi:hypothetical protein
MKIRPLQDVLLVFMCYKGGTNRNEKIKQRQI